MDEDGRRDGDLPCRCHGGVIGYLMMHRRDQYTEEATPEGGSAWRHHGEVHMTIDFLLSALHFLLVFSLVAILAAQGAHLRRGMTSPNLRLAAKLDRGYGAGSGAASRRWIWPRIPGREGITALPFESLFLDQDISLCGGGCAIHCANRATNPVDQAGPPAGEFPAPG